jgi:uncharacterized protein
MMDFPGERVVNWDGAIYPCPGLVGRAQFRLGDIGAAEAGGGARTAPAWHNETCLACAYLPLCFGGCRYMAFLRTGSTAGLDCRKAYFDAVLEPLVLQDIRYGVGS